MENGFSSPRSDAFPVGLRVLVVDDDLTWLKILEKMLKKCCYEVTTCCLAKEALSLLRERKDGFDIVISDVNMPDMDGFKLLEHVGLEMDLPVIMMSVDGETTRVMKGVQHGACDYLLKPIRMKELRNIWQHVFRKKIHELRDFETLDCIEDVQMMRSGLDQYDTGFFICGGDLSSSKKRKDFESKHEDGDPSSTKKPRVVWSVDLHQKFVKAVKQIGYDKLAPKKILDLMNVPGLTRENVASHLQKYRLYLGRLQKGSNLGTADGLNHSFPSSNDPAQNVGLQNSNIMLQKNPVDGNNEVSEGKILAQNLDPKIQENGGSDIISQPTGKPVAGVHDTPNANIAGSSNTGLVHFSELEDLEVNFLAFDSCHPSGYSWDGKISEMQFKGDLQSQNAIKHVPFPGSQYHGQANLLQPTQATGNELSSTKVTNEVQSIEVKPLHASNRSTGVIEANPTGSGSDWLSAQSGSSLGSFRHSEMSSTTRLNMRSQHMYQSSINNFEANQQNLNSGSGSVYASSGENLQICWPQGNCNPGMSLGIQSLQSLQSLEFDFYNPELFGDEVPFQFYDGSMLEYGYLTDSTEYSQVHQGLFLA